MGRVPKQLQASNANEIAFHLGSQFNGRTADLYPALEREPPDQRIVQVRILVGPYKRYDSYVKQKGYKNLNIAPSALTIIDPSAGNTNKIHLYWDVEAGANYLTYLRKTAKTKTILL